jgi:hypothetical protein
MKNKLTVAVAGLALFGGAPLFGQDAADSNKFVTREEFQKLRQENEQLKGELQGWREFKAQFEQWKQQQAAATNAVVVTPAPVTGIVTGTGAGAGTGTNVVDKGLSGYLFPGTTDFLLTGYGTANFSSKHNSDAAFGAQFNPMLLWKLSDRLLFEGELEFELEDSETSTALETANLSYLVNDVLTFQAGKFLNPMNSFVERFHMAWVNRLPDKPLAVYDGLLPESYVGAQLRGGAPIGPTKINYAAFIANAPNLITSIGPDDDRESLGSLEFDNFGNTGGRIAAGGHVGFLPLPEVEIGYGFHYSGLGGSSDNALLQSVDLNYMRDSELLRGQVRLNAQWVWSQLGSGTYDDDGTPLRFKNDRDGGYAQISYRPTHFANEHLRRVEGVFRYDMLNQDKTPVGFDETRYTLGLNYWISPKTVFKASYEFDERTAHEPEQSGVLVEFATGF